MHLVVHVGKVGFPVSVGDGAVVEGVGKRVYINQLELAVDDSCKHRLQFLVFIGQLYVGPHLRT